MALFGPKRGFGLDISDFSIKALELDKKGNEIIFKNYGQIEIPNKQLVENGEIKEKEALLNAIKELLNKTEPERIKTRYVLLSLPEAKIFSHIFEFPVNLTIDQINEAIAYEIESIFPYQAKDLFMDFKVIKKEEKIQEIFLAACPKYIVNGFKEVLEKAGLIGIVFDLESQSLARSIINKFEDGKAYMIIDIGARTSIISVFDKLGLRFSTNIKLAGNRFNKEVAAVLTVPLEEAEKIKIKEGFLSEKFGSVLEKTSEVLCQEIKKVVEYTQEKYNFKIDQILLAGGSSLLPGIEEYFTERIGIIAKRGDPLIKLNKDNAFAKKEKTIMYANVIGLALRALEKDPIHCDINLLKS
jgi:type IV pilus assembly protein PilM